MAFPGKWHASLSHGGGAGDIRACGKSHMRAPRPRRAYPPGGKRQFGIPAHPADAKAA
jgi:hypothetical protein